MLTEDRGVVKVCTLIRWNTKQPLMKTTVIAQAPENIKVKKSTIQDSVSY